MEQLEKKLQVQNLRISFKTAAGKVQAVRGITFDLYKGETLAIVGESGSGKSVTSKAILGIQAANAVTEGGEILYDGMDLLQIDEQDFCRLRGDRLAMIFQDPLSSLNPIMRVGKQLTEAMLLKSRMRKNNSRTAFRERTHLLEQTMQTRFPERRDLARQMEQYRKMETALGAAEKASTDARQALARILPLLERLCFLKEKNGRPLMGPAKRRTFVRSLSGCRPSLTGNPRARRFLKEAARPLRKAMRQRSGRMPRRELRPPWSALQRPGKRRCQCLNPVLRPSNPAALRLSGLTWPTCQARSPGALTPLIPSGIQGPAPLPGH